MISASARKTLGLGWCTLLVVCAAAQPHPKPASDLGAPGPEHRKLDVLAGTWDVTVRLPAGPDGHVEGRSSCEASWVLDGRFLRQDYSSTFAGKPLRVVRYLGFDRQKGKFVELHFESTHTDVLHGEGDLTKDGRTITCTGTHVDAATGQAAGVRTVTTFVDEDAFTLEMIYLDAEGKDSKRVTLAHKRKKEMADTPSLYRMILQVSDLDKAADFYSRLLDAKGRRVAQGRHYFDCGPVILALVDPSIDGEKAKAAPDYTYFSVKDLEAIHARATALGCLAKETVHDEPAGEIVKRPWGERSFYATDPFGNGLCFVDARTIFTGE